MIGSRVRMGAAALVLFLQALLLVVVMASCSSSPATGRLKLTVSGLPSGVNAAVTVTRGSYSHTVTATTTLSGLVPGTYTVAPQTVTLRRNAFDGTTSSTGVSVAANATANASVTYAVQPGDLWVANLGGGAAGAGSVVEYPGSALSGTPTGRTALIGLNGPVNVAFDSGGNLWLASAGDNTVVEYLAASLSGTPTTGTSISGLGKPYGIAFDSSGNLWIANVGAGTAGSGSVVEYLAASLSGTPTTGTSITGLNTPYGIAFDSNGNLWVAISDALVAGGGTVVAPGGGSVVEYLASSLSGTPATGTSITGLTFPAGIAFDSNGNAWVGLVDPNFAGAGTVVEYLAASLSGTPGTGTTITGFIAPMGLTFDSSGNLWVPDLFGTSVVEYLAASLSGTPQPRTTITGLSNPGGVAFDPPPYNLPTSH